MTLDVKSLFKTFENPPTPVLFDISFSIQAGEFVSITGKSGSGKSTLLYIISSLDVPTSGDVFLDQKSMTKMSADELHRFRNESMGFIFQFHFLLPELTALENVLMPARKQGLHKKLEGRGKEILARVEMENKMNRLPRELSGGEQQRVAIARALIMNPRFIFADEPTGNLDSINGNRVIDILEGVTRTNQTSVIYVTHDLDFAARASRQLKLVDGHLAN